MSARRAASLSSRHPRRRRLHPFASILASAGVAIVGTLLFLITQYLGRPPERVEPVLLSGENWRETFQDRVDAVTAKLEHGAAALTGAVTERQGSGPVRWLRRRYEIAVPHGEAPRLRHALESVRDPENAATVALIENTDGIRAEIGVDGLNTHTVVVRWRDRDESQTARVAVVIDDLGNDLLVASKLVSLDYPVTLAIMPFRPFSHEVAEKARFFGREVLLHLPMEAENGVEFGDEGLLRVESSRDELLRQLDRNLAAVPYIIGVNNHMGSRFTQNRERMTWVLQRLKERRLFFLDSLTSPRSVAGEVASSIGIPYRARQVFLDDGADTASVGDRLQELLGIARQRGSAIGIGHPRPKTLSALGELGAMAEKRGVEIVPLSALIK